MIRLGIVCTVAALVASGSFSTALGAGPKSRPHTHAHDDEADDVNLVLFREQTRTLDRRAELHSVLNRQPDLAPARWHSGYVETSGSWRSYASPADPQTLELLEQYRRKRSILDGTVRAQVHLAHWCHEQGLRDQARAHLTAALADAQPADRPAIYERLGYHQIGDHWLSPGEIAEWSTIGKQAEASFKHWGPIIERIAAQLDGNPHLKRIARKALEDIRDPAAIPALESALLYRNEVGAHAAIETLQQIDAYQASQALSRAAVFTNSDSVRAAATEALKTRRMNDYIPSLIDLLSTDVQPRFEACSVNRGIVFFTYLLVREKGDEVDVRARTVLHPAVEVFHLHYNRSQRRWYASNPSNNIAPEVRLDLARNQLDETYLQQRQLGQQNESIEQVNGRAIGVLAAVTGQQLGHKPQDWWNWWDRETDRQQVLGKTVVRVDEFDVSSTPLPTMGFSKGSCFLAGTPVWTETGPVPIEKLQIGDRVLAQNVETGELAYKPVLKATVRPAKDLVRVAAGDEEIVCTGGHQFWASGKAWVKARDLTPAHILHTATGTVGVDTVSPADVAKTYNLVIADYHSYFVGEQVFLVQDLPLPRSTNCVVPGLQAKWK